MLVKKESYNLDKPLFLVEDYDNEDSRFTLCENIESFEKSKVDSYVNDIYYFMNENEEWTDALNGDVLDNLLFIACPPKKRPTSWRYKKNLSTFYPVYRVDPEFVRDYVHDNDIVVRTLGDIDPDDLFYSMDSKDIVKYQPLDIADILYHSFPEDIKEKIKDLSIL